MAGYLIIGHACGSSMVSQCRYAFSRQSSIHLGSFFLAEMKRMISSLSPGGTESASMSVTNPHLYSRFARSWISVVSVGMGHSFHFLRAPDCTGIRRLWHPSDNYRRSERSTKQHSELKN